MGAGAVSKTVNIYLNSDAAQASVRQLQGKFDTLAEHIRKGQSEGKLMIKEIAQLKQLEGTIDSFTNKIKNGLSPSFNQLKSLVNQTRAELKKMSEDDPGYVKKTKQLNAYSTEMTRLGREIGIVKKEGGGLKEMFAELLPVATIAVATRAVVGFFKGAIDEAVAADKAAGRLRGTLDNLGKADAFDRLASKAEAMEKRFKFIDNDDVIGVFEQLITYGKLTEVQIDKLTPVIIDFAAKSRISLAESASVIIKALEGNGKALKEYGINIKDAKTDSERLAVVMDVLGGKVRGAADAFGNTFAGNLATAEQQIKTLKEEVGTGLLPVLRAALGMLKGILSPSTTVKSTADITKMAMQGMSTEQIKAALRKNSGIDKVTTDLTFGLGSSNEVLGSGGTTAAVHEKTGKAAKDHAGEVAKLRKEYEDLLAKLYEAMGSDNPYLKGIREANDLAEKEGVQLKLLLKQKIISQAEFADTSLKIEEARLIKIKELYNKYAKDGQINGVDPFAHLGLTGGPQRDFTKDTKRITDDALAGAELAVITSRGKKRLDAQKYQLNLQMAAELANTNLTEQQKELIEEQYRQKKAALEDAALLAQKTKMEQIFNVAAGLLNIADIFNQAADAKDQAKQKQIDQQTTEDERRLKRNLDNKIISQKEYDRQDKALHAKADKEKHALEVKQFERAKRMQVIQAIMSGAQGIASLLAARPGPLDGPSFMVFRAINIAITAATTAAQIATITSQKAPSYARGGLLNGPTHSQGGMPVINPRTGHKVAEIEGGEAILSRNTVRNNRMLVNELLASSMYGNGAPIVPYWKNQPYRSFNYGGMMQTIQRHRMYERGGIFTGGGDGSITNNTITQMSLGNMENLLHDIKNNLALGPQRNYVLISDVNAANDLLDNIKKETTIPRK